MTNPNPALANATAAWYNAVCSQLGLSQGSFQLLGGQGVPLGEDAESVWSLADTIPATVAVANANDFVSSRSTFSSAYGALLGYLQDPKPSQFQEALGEDFPHWTEYLQKNPYQPGDTEASKFTSWAMQQGYSQSTIDADIELMNTDTPLTQANAKYTAAVASGNAFAYNFTLDDITDGLAASPAVPITVSSTADAASLDNTWAHGRADVWWGIFGGQSTTSYQHTSDIVAQAGMSITGQFDHSYVRPCLPLSTTSDDSFFADYLPWYSSSIVSMAYENNDNQLEVWRTGKQGAWNDFFGPGGQLAQAITELVVVDGMNFAISASVSLSEEDQTNIQHATEGGIFPFFAGGGQGAVTTSVSSVNSSGFSVTVSSEPGNPLLLGVTVLPVSSYTS